MTAVQQSGCDQLHHMTEGVHVTSHFTSCGAGNRKWMLVSSVASNTGTEANAGPSPGFSHLHTERGGDLLPLPPQKS